MPALPTMISVEQALAIVLDHVRITPVESRPLSDALGMTLAEPILADLDDPPFDRAMMDGYAVRGADVASAPATLNVIGQVAAGTASDRSVTPGSAMQINTGAPLPAGGDTVVRVEDTVEDNSKVTISRRYQSGAHIARRATNVRSGDVVLPAGTRLGAVQAASAAAAGAANVRVHRRPTVAVLVTGNELVDAGCKPTGASIRNSNGPALVALFAECQVQATSLGIGRDEPDDLERRIREGLEHDVLCITGGVSMGKLDLVPAVLEQCGVRFAFRKLAIRPGKPTLFGTSPSGGMVFALPGNPVSALVAFVLLIRPALAAIQGSEACGAAMLDAVLAGSATRSADRESYLPATVRIGADGRLAARALRWAGSGDAFGIAPANALIVLPAGDRDPADGDAIRIVPLDRF